MTDFSKTIFRASSISRIMADPSGKSNMERYNDALALLADEQAKYDALPKKDGKMAQNKLEKIAKVQAMVDELDKIKHQERLSDGCKTYLKRVYVNTVFGKKAVSEYIETKQMTKGITVEEDSIMLLSRLDGVIYEKNTKRLTNEWVGGTPDIIIGEEIKRADYIIDVKSSWDIESFIGNLGAEVSSPYWWQLQVYMWLTGAERSEIAYCLVNTPEVLLNDEKYRLLRRMNCVTDQDPKYVKAAANLEFDLTFDDIAIEKRVIRQSVDREEAMFDKIARKVELCREYLAEIEQIHDNHAAGHLSRVGNLLSA